MSEEPIIRQAVPADADALRSFMRDLGEEELPQIFAMTQVPSTDRQRKFITHLAEAERSVLLVVAAGEEIAGLLDFHGYPQPQRAHAGWFGMAVGRAWRRRGLGAELLDALLAWAPAQGITRIELGVLANNPGAIRLYEQRGFVREGRRVGAAIIDGDNVDLIEMALRR